MAEESKMEEQLKKPTRIIVPDLSFNVPKTKTTSRSIPSSPVGLRKAASIRSNCLCSPTTHAGSFRCRHHRNSSSNLMRSSMSVGSKLSELAADKSNGTCGDTLRKQITIAGHHNHGS
ncbi:hypothetical protein ABFS82_13G006600 [Erythranthe guttata]|uniref:Serine-rich protein-like protein n=1 Tax=Erythranthe guttata TaxID=4155 RepID=A0A022RSP5_ERYGU|nr:PREDICTED: uncharacterized protein LOC105951856 [Erythranthe guttata]EYU42798.1 hypothetical protein MIMGU_mgv1a020387mg [Erythranthe guttata]|eukprot:XP_012830768.1 PREDICTED: uncharacterized protein LOC105951856 [Erythranthe guttata]